MRFNRDFELSINLLVILHTDIYQTSRSLAEILGTTELYLQGIVLKLKKAKLVETLSGGQGGVRRSPLSTNALDILVALKRKPKNLEGKAGEILTNILNALKEETL